ncbi:MAG: AbrB/MazE/SpoVT family DNA-binding domain-containing protein [Acidobacteria bacterium]|nr:AbrB/MazE/SpoVT family DNA-binding domain-containing protein [Acidobacteriota bacterium]
MKTTVSEKGQITIPKALRESLGLEPGTELDFEERDGRLVATPVVRTDPMEKLVGLIARVDVDDAIARMRGPGWDPKVDGRHK